jgi:multimeric flavodoxin WrbA
MKALLLSGATDTDGTLGTITCQIDEALRDSGWTIEKWLLHSSEIAYCHGCFDCWKTTPGECSTDDDGRLVARALIASDLLILLTPVTFGGHSSTLKKALDRLIPDIAPWTTTIDGETHHKPRYERYPDLLAIGTLAASDPDQERTFATLVARNAINFHAARHAAAVVADGAPEAVLKLRVTALLAEMGVTKTPAASSGAERETEA